MRRHPYRVWVWLPCILAGCVWPASAQPPARPAESGYLLELESPPAVKAHAASLANKASKRQAIAAARQAIARNEEEQRKLLAALSGKRRDFPVLFTVQRVFNGVAVRTEARHLDRLAAMPGVRAVHRLSRVRPSRASSLPFTGVSALWPVAAGGLTGEGVSIGIIDTGIDYLHPDFGGLGLDSIYRNNDNTVVGDVPYPTVKVAGGYDFAGDDYDAQDYQHATPQPDPDPMDAWGHGTHVAGIAAGYGVTPGRATYTGPYDESVPERDWLIGPGAAPRATLYALKIFGRSGESEILAPAVEWAVDPNGDGDFSDHLDIINLSLGESFGRADSPESIICDMAAQAGVLVVASAGNSNDSYFITGTPGSAAWALSVAATEDDDPEQPLIPDRLARFSSRGPSGGPGGVWLKPDVCAPGRLINSASAYAANPSNLASLNSGTSMAAPHAAGLMALLRQQRPAWTVPQLKALVMNTATGGIVSGAEDALIAQSPGRTGAGRADAVRAAGAWAVAYGAAAPERVSVSSATDALTAPETEVRNVVVENLDAAPVTFDVGIEPAVTMPGVEVALDSNRVVVAPGEARPVGLRFVFDPAQMAHSRDPALRLTTEGLQRFWLSEFSGHVAFTPPGGEGPALRVPYYGAPRPASMLAPVPQFLDARATGTLTCTVNAGNSLADVSFFNHFELLGYDENDAYSTGAEDMADIAYVGIASDYPARGGAVEDTMLYLAIATHGHWYTPHIPQFFVYLDTDGDRASDYYLYNGATPGDVPLGPYPDIFVSKLSDFSEERVVQDYLNGAGPVERHTGVFRNNVLILPVRAADLGLSAGNTKIQFDIESFLLEREDTLIDIMPAEPPGAERARTFVYDLARPGLYNAAAGTGVPTLDAAGETTLVLQFAEADYLANGTLDQDTGDMRGTLGLLLAFPHNMPGERTAWLPVLTAGDSDNDGISDGEEGLEDPDGDGLPNHVDPDADGDELPDTVEGTDDPDGDGVPNYLDTDSDGDGLSDAEEDLNGNGAVDTGESDPYNPDTDGDGLTDAVEDLDDADGDGLINAIDPDADGDGWPDATEGALDVDGDTLPNFLDTDSDGDGLSDSAEDLNGNGQHDPGEPDPYLRDSDGDRLDDGVEGLGDPDGDGVPNALDDDSDGDTLADLLEGASDDDGDGIPNFLDTDADGDGVPDRVEAVEWGTHPFSPDTDADGIPDGVEGMEDPDGDGVGNALDDDSDGDSISDFTETAADTDNDGIPNYLDLDADGDTVPDAIEQAVWGTDPFNPDTDEDGIRDDVEGNADADGDGRPNARDIDSDGDGIQDAIEGADDYDGDGTANFLDTDSDGDGIPDAVEGAADPDEDGAPNFLDTDSDGDGIPDSIEDAEDMDGDGAPNFLDEDSDGDGIPDATEGAVDSDHDGTPDFLDLDSDADGIGDAVQGAGDPDADGIPSYLDLDSDGDGIADGIEGAEDPDGDGLINALDTDNDGDGIPDALEGVRDADGDGTPNFLDLDADGDGIPDAEEGEIDTDSDGRPDFLDTDSDNDGRGDAAENAAGLDPRTPDPPEAPTGLTASGGTQAGYIEVTWEAAAGAAEYRVWRAPENIPAAAPISGWLTATRFEDTHAAPPEVLGGGCRKAHTEFTRYRYQVEARIHTQGFEPTAPSPLSAPDTGWRGVAKALWRWLLP